MVESHPLFEDRLLSVLVVYWWEWYIDKGNIILEPTFSEIGQKKDSRQIDIRGSLKSYIHIILYIIPVLLVDNLVYNYVTSHLKYGRVSCSPIVNPLRSKLCELPGGMYVNVSYKEY